MGCGLGASPTMATALLPYLEMEPGRAGHRLHAEREERARRGLKASVSDLFLRTKGKAARSCLPLGGENEQQVKQRPLLANCSS